MGFTQKGVGSGVTEMGGNVGVQERKIVQCKNTSCNLFFIPKSVHTNCSLLTMFLRRPNEMIRTADIKHLINNSILSRLINITAGSILLSIGGKKMHRHVYNDQHYLSGLFAVCTFCDNTLMKRVITFNGGDWETFKVFPLCLFDIAHILKGKYKRGRVCVIDYLIELAGGIR